MSLTYKLNLNIENIYSGAEMNLIRGEYFPSIADKVLIHYDQLSCDPLTINDGDIVYCDTHHILKFKEILNQKKNLIIVTHNSDHSICDGKPQNKNMISVDEFVCYNKWYGQNSYSNKENVIPLPIGFENKRWERIFGPKTEYLTQIKKENIEPDTLVYFNCNKNTNLNSRQDCYNKCHSLDYVTCDEPNLKYDEYLSQIKKHKFCLSPSGNGLDCHRTWEVLAMGRVPILKKEGSLERLYRDFPVLFVDDWGDINNIDLETVYEKFCFENQNYLYFNFWRV
jgi:hypothetical protein